MAKYRKKPVVIEAEQFICSTPKLDQPVTGRTGEMFMGYPVFVDEVGPFLIIHTLEGNHRANAGDWIITGIKGERYPCKPDIFEATYYPEATTHIQS